jgi:Txe/YoeB family toxin of Txe-Axe toxin-antitoxin module
MVKRLIEDAWSKRVATDEILVYECPEGEIGE